MLKLRVKLDTLLCGIMFLCICYITVRYCDLNDYRAYYLSYCTNRKMSIEIGYTALESLFFQMGMPFYVYYGILEITGLFLYMRFFRSNCRNAFPILCLMIIFPYINMLQQVRSIIGAAFAVYGTRYLLEEKPRTVPFIVCAGIGTLFHTTTILYLLFLPAVKANYARLRRFTFWLFATALPLMAVIRLIVARIVSAIPYMAMKYTKLLYTGNIFTKTVLFDWALFFMLFLAVSYVIKTKTTQLSERTGKLINITHVVFCLTLLRGTANNGYRIALMMYPVMYVALYNLMREMTSRRGKGIIRWILILFPIVCLLFWWGPVFPDMFRIVRTEMWRVWDYFY